MEEKQFITGEPSIEKGPSMEKEPSIEKEPSTEEGLALEIYGIFYEGEREGKYFRDIRTYSPLTLAYVGDGIYDLIIRTMVVERANRPANDLHRLTIRYVSANAQSKIVRELIKTLRRKNNRFIAGEKIPSLTLRRRMPALRITCALQALKRYWDTCI